MNDLVPLSELPADAAAVIAEIHASTDETNRLAELGIIPETGVKVKLFGSGGSPVAFEIHGVTLALRKEDCARILVRPLTHTKTIMLAGNPNVGKSTVFNTLTGLHQHTGNWCGKTVSGAEGWIMTDGTRMRCVDTPGTYALCSETAEEAETGRLMREIPHDLVICVCDATCPVRGIALAIELLAAQEHVILCMNLMDEAKKKQIEPDLAGISDRLHVPVIGISAKRKRTLIPLLDAVSHIPDLNRDFVGYTHQDALREAGAICAETIRIPDYASRMNNRLDRLLTAAPWKYPVMLLMLLAVFWLTMVGANYPSALLFDLFTAICSSLHQISELLNLPPWLSGALIDGVLRGTGWVVSVMLPPMAIFFPLFTLLEDAGLLPRIAFNLDTCCAKCKACGKQALTMTMGFGCNAVGVTECRIIQSKRERLIAILTNALVPCNGRFPALLAIVTVFFAGDDMRSSFRAAAMMTALILFSVGVTFAASALLGRTVLRGEPSSFVLEMPPYRRPQIGHVIVRSVLDRTVFVLGRAVMTAAPVSLLIWILANISLSGETLLQRLADIMQPLGSLIGMDGVMLLAFLLGLPANEIVLPVALTAYLGTGSLTDYESLQSLHTLLTAHGWTLLTASCFLIFTLFHSPCATTLLTVYKETRSRRWTFAAFLLPTVIGTVLCMILVGIAHLL